MSKVIARTDLHYVGGTSDKVYNVSLVEDSDAIVKTTVYAVIAQWGKRGGKLREMNKILTKNASEAKDVYLKIINDQVAEGYKPIKVTAGTSTAIGSAATGLIGTVPIPDDLDKPQKVVEPLYVPQLLNPIGYEVMCPLIYDDNYIFQEKYAGKRMMLGHNHDGPVVAWNKKGEPIEPPEEFVKVINSCFGEFEFIIDGEAVGNKYYVFDLLIMEKTDYRPHSYESRLSYLGMLVRSASEQNMIELAYTACSIAEKEILLNVMEGRRKEGVAIKDRRAPYTAGRPDNDNGSQLSYEFASRKTPEEIEAEMEEQRLVTAFLKAKKGYDKSVKEADNEGITVAQKLNKQWQALWRNKKK